MTVRATRHKTRTLWTRHPATWVLLRVVLVLGLIAAAAVVVAEAYGYVLVTPTFVRLETIVLALAVAVVVVSVVLLLALANLRSARLAVAETRPRGPPRAVPPRGMDLETPPPERSVDIVPGLGAHAVERLARIEVETLHDLVNTDPDRLVRATGVDAGIVRQWQRLAELMLIPGVGPRSAELLIAAGVRSIDDLAHERPEDLLDRLRAIGRDRPVTMHELDAGPGRVEHWVHAARRHLATPR